MKKIFRKIIIVFGLSLLSFFEIANFSKFELDQLAWAFLGCFLAVTVKHIVKPAMEEALKEKKSKRLNNPDKPDP